MTVGEETGPGDSPSRRPLALLIGALVLPIVLAGAGLFGSSKGEVVVPAGGSAVIHPTSTRPIGNRPTSTTSASTPTAPAATAAAGSLELGFEPDALDPVLVGVAVADGDPALVEALERTTGADVDLVRVFARWDSDFPSARHQALLDAGKTLHLSVRPRTEAGLTIPWAEIATAVPGSAVHEQLVAWTTAVAAIDGQIYFTLNHEPETTQSAGAGTPDEFVAAWRRTIELLRGDPSGGDPSDGGTALAVLVLGRRPYETGEVVRWYPGDDVVDVVGVDPYNWYGCQGTDRPWTPPEDLLRAALDFAEARGKPLAVPEIASTEDPHDPERKAAWILELAAFLGTPDVAEHLAFVAWFDVHDATWPNCDWAVDSTPASFQAFEDLLTALAPRGP